MVLAVLAMEATMTVGTLYVSSAYVSGGDAPPSLATAMSVNPTTQGVIPGALDQVDLERAADLYRVTP